MVRYVVSFRRLKNMIKDRIEQKRLIIHQENEELG